MEANYGALNTTLSTILGQIDAAGSKVDGTLAPVFFTVGCLLLVFACMKTMWQKRLEPLAGFVVQFAMLMGVVTLSAGWMPLIDGYMAGMGNYGARLGGFDVDQLSPGTVIVKGLTLADKMYTENVSWMRVIFGTNEDTAANVVMLIVCVGTILVSALMSVFLMLFYVIMKLAGVVALVFLVMILFEWSRFMAAPGVARILAYGVQMLIMSLVAGSMFTVLDALELSDRLKIDEALSTFVIVAFFAFLFYHTTTIAREQISGMPSLSLNEVGDGMVRGAMGAASMLPGAVGAAGALLRSAGGMPSLPRWNGSPGGSAGSGNLPSVTSAGPSVGGSGGVGGLGGGGGAPGAAYRMIERSRIIDGEWTDARDLSPRAAQRMLSQGQARLPDNSRPALPAPPRSLPPPRFS